MNDALNAEISLGTVSSVNDAVKWLGYTYLFVRARKNPMAYGMTFPVIWLLQGLSQFPPGMLLRDVAEDPGLGAKRIQLVTNAVHRLAEARMVNWNRSTGGLQVTDLGKIAAKYYIRVASIEIFNQRFRSRMSEADVLKMLSHSTEVRLFYLPHSVRFLTLLRTKFNQIQLRESEVKELDALEKRIPCEVRSPEAKVGCSLLPGFPLLTWISGWNRVLTSEGQHIATVLHLAIPLG
jgi:antiviral helicase SLH1